MLKIDQKNSEMPCTICEHETFPVMSVTVLDSIGDELKTSIYCTRCFIITFPKHKNLVPKDEPALNQGGLFD